MTYTFSPAQYKLDHCTHLTWKLGHQLKWDHYKHPLSYHCVLCWGDLGVSLSMVCTVLAGQNKWDHWTHLTWNLGHRMKWDHYKHPLSYHFVLCWGDLFSLDYIYGYQYELLKGPCVYGFYSFAWTEQVRPLHASYLKTGSLTEVRPLQAPLHITLCPLLGCCFHIKSYLLVPKRTVQMSLCPWFVLFCLGRTSETTARILLQN